jgi:hypothetical protein
MPGAKTSWIGRPMKRVEDGRLLKLQGDPEPIDSGPRPA